MHRVRAQSCLKSLKEYALTARHRMDTILLLIQCREKYKAGYDLVPKHWLKFEDTVNTGERSTLWVSCIEGQCGKSVLQVAQS